MVSWLFGWLVVDSVERKKEKREEVRRNHRRESLVEVQSYLVYRHNHFLDGDREEK